MYLLDLCFFTKIFPNIFVPNGFFLSAPDDGVWSAATVVEAATFFVEYN